MAQNIGIGSSPGNLGIGGDDLQSQQDMPNLVVDSDDDVQVVFDESSYYDNAAAMAQNEGHIGTQVQNSVPGSNNNDEIVPDSLETQPASDSIESANNVSPNCQSSGVCPQVQKDLKFLKSKFWADGKDANLDDDISVSFPGNQDQDKGEDSSFTKVLSKSQKKKLRKIRNKQMAQSKAGPLNFAS